AGGLEGGAAAMAVDGMRSAIASTAPATARGKRSKSIMLGPGNNSPFRNNGWLRSFVTAIAMKKARKRPYNCRDESVRGFLGRDHCRRQPKGRRWQNGHHGQPRHRPLPSRPPD